MLIAGDVVLVKHGGWGMCDADVGKYVEILSHKGKNWVVKEYDCKLETVGLDFVYEQSFGNPLSILLDTKDDPLTKTKETNDVVNSPKHYSVFEDKEAIIIIASSMTVDQFYGYCFGNILKYRLRAGNKDNLQQEINKADKYKDLFTEHKILCKINA